MADKKYKFIDGNVIELTPSEVLEVETKEAEWDAHLAEEAKTQYQRDRQAEYPSVADFMEAYTEKEIGSSSTKWDAYVTAYNKVRSDNPKP